MRRPPQNMAGEGSAEPCGEDDGEAAQHADLWDHEESTIRDSVVCCSSAVVGRRLSVREHTG